MATKTMQTAAKVNPPTPTPATSPGIVEAMGAKMRELKESAEERRRLAELTDAAPTPIVACCPFGHKLERIEIQFPAKHLHRSPSPGEAIQQGQVDNLTVALVCPTCEEGFGLPGGHWSFQIPFPNASMPGQPSPILFNVGRRLKLKTDGGGK